MIADFLRQGGFKGGLVIWMWSVHTIDYRIHPEIVLQVEVAPQRLVVLYSKFDPQIEVSPQLEISLQRESGN
jgi:hypothetical protein